MMTRTTMDPARTAEPTTEALLRALREAEDNEADRLDRLIAAAQQLSELLARTAASLTANPAALVNDLGVVQGLGPEIDRLCGELAQARKAARTLRRLRDASPHPTA